MKWPSPGRRRKILSISAPNLSRILRSFPPGMDNRRLLRTRTTAPRRRVKRETARTYTEEPVESRAEGAP